MNQKPFYNWVFLYWMPYDNNLSFLKEPIIKMIQSGIQGKNVMAVVEADVLDEYFISRTIISSKGRRVESLHQTNSASIDVFADYLHWAQSHFNADKWAIVFLGHGGSLDKLSPDENPGYKAGFGTQWLNIDSLSRCIEEFGNTIGQNVELLFLQNCCKGTLEAHYTFRNAARYTLSSQTVLGAPNYYYESLFHFLESSPESDGANVASKIIEFERDDMYNGYVVTDNSAMRELPAKLDPLIDSILTADTKALDLTALDNYSHFYMNEKLVDALALFQTLNNQSNAPALPLAKFTAFYRKKLIHQFQNSPHTKYPHYSGLSCLLPRTQKHLAQYDYLDLFSDSKLSKLYMRVLFGEESD